MRPSAASAASTKAVTWSTSRMSHVPAWTRPPAPASADAGAAEAVAAAKEAMAELKSHGGKDEQGEKGPSAPRSTP